MAAFPYSSPHQPAARAALQAGDEAVLVVVSSIPSQNYTRRVTITEADGRFVSVGEKRFHRHNGKLVGAGRHRSAPTSFYLYALTDDVGRFFDVDGVPVLVEDATAAARVLAAYADEVSQGVGSEPFSSSQPRPLAPAGEAQDNRSPGGPSAGASEG